MALNGINLALAWSGQEAVWQRVRAHHILLPPVSLPPPSPASGTQTNDFRSICGVHDGPSHLETGFCCRAKHRSACGGLEPGIPLETLSEAGLRSLPTPTAGQAAPSLDSVSSAALDLPHPLYPDSWHQFRLLPLSLGAPPRPRATEQDSWLLNSSHVLSEVQVLWRPAAVPTGAPVTFRLSSAWGLQGP